MPIARTISLESFAEVLKLREELHPDLKTYQFGPDEDPHTKLGWPTLKHPLLYAVPYEPELNALYNRQYAVRKEGYDKAIHDKKWGAAIAITERPWRLQTFQRCATHMSDRDYWELLNDCWTDSENIWQHDDEWHELLSSPRKGFRRYFMDAEERQFLKDLPEMVTVYRGCCKDLNEGGLSWTLDKDRATWFSRRLRRPGEVPLVLERTVPKRQIKAYLAGRGESEVLLLHPPV